MAAVNGTLYAVFAIVGGIATAAAATDRVASCKTASLKVDIDLPDASTKDSAAWAQHITGLRNASIDFSGVWDEAATGTLLTVNEIMVLLLAGNAEMKFAFIPAAMGTTLKGWKFVGSFKGISIDAPAEQPCTFAGSAVANGALVLFDS